MTSEEKIIRQFNSKQIETYRYLFEQFYAYLVLYAERYVFQKEVAEDIVQETFVALWEQEKEYNSLIGLKAYLYETVRNRALDYLKHKQVEGKYSSYIQANLEDGSDLEYKLMREEIYRQLHLAVSVLPARCRQIFELGLEGKKNEEIATLLDLSVETIKTQRKIALRILRERLGKLFIFLLLLQE